MSRTVIRNGTSLVARARFSSSTFTPAEASGSTSVQRFTSESQQRQNSNREGHRPRKASGPAPNLLAVTLAKLSALKSQNAATAQAYQDVIKQCAAATSRLPTTPRHGITPERRFFLDIALSAVEDARASGIELSSEALDSLSELAKEDKSLIPSLMALATKEGHWPTALYAALSQVDPTKGHVRNFHPKWQEDVRADQRLFIVTEMLAKGLVPPPVAIDALMTQCCVDNMPRLALELSKKFKALPGIAEISLTSWIAILTSSADNFYLEGIEQAWARLEDTQMFTPDGGLLMKIMDAGARLGNPDLVTKSIAALADIDITPGEEHLTALTEAFVNASRVPDAIRTISNIRQSGLPVTLDTARSIVNVLTTPNLIDQAFYAAEDLHKAGEPVDIVVLDALIAASVCLGDLQRARANQLAIKDFGLTPTIDSFNLILDACLIHKFHDLGEIIMKEMGEVEGLKPNRATYERIILLSVAAETSYEDAFFYLEAMKTAGMMPTRATYDSLLRRCLEAQDSRWKMVSEEMQELGYTMTAKTLEVARKHNHPHAQG